MPCGTAVSNLAPRGTLGAAFARLITQAVPQARPAGRKMTPPLLANERSSIPGALPRIGREAWHSRKTRTWGTCALAAPQESTPRRATPPHPVAPHGTDHPPLEPPKRGSRSRHVGDARCLPPREAPLTSSSTVPIKAQRDQGPHTNLHTDTTRRRPSPPPARAKPPPTKKPARASRAAPAAAPPASPESVSLRATPPRAPRRARRAPARP